MLHEKTKFLLFLSLQFSFLSLTNEPRHEKTCLREFPTGSDSNWPAQLQKLAGGLKFWLQKLDITLSRQRTIKALIKLRAAQADLRLCCSHMT